MQTLTLTIKEAQAENLTFTQWFKQSEFHVERKNKYQLLWDAHKSKSIPQKTHRRESLIVVDINGFPLGSYKAESLTVHQSQTDAQAFGLEHFGKFKFQIINFHKFKRSEIGRYIARRQACLNRLRQFRQSKLCTSKPN